MWNLDVPKICHIYWGGERMPYMRYLTIKSFLLLNPGWEVWLWMPQESSEIITWESKENNYPLDCSNFLPVALSLPVKKKYIDFADIEKGKLLAEVHRADYIRIMVLQEYGGVWSDSDIIYFKPISSLAVNVETNKNMDVYVTICEYGHSTGFLMARPDSFFYRKLRYNIMEDFVASHYQCIGPGMFNKYFSTISSIPNSVNISMDAVYRYRFQDIARLMGEQDGLFNSESIGCHWYGGNTIWANFIRETNGGIINIPHSIIGDLLRPYNLIL